MGKASLAAWHGLLALQAYQQQRYSVPLNFLDDWQNQIDHLLAQEEAHQHQLSGDLRNALLQLSAPYDKLFPNLSQQQFSLHYQAVRQIL